MDEATKSSARPERTRMQAEANIITDLINSRVLTALVSQSSDFTGSVDSCDGALFIPGHIEYREGAKVIPSILNAIGVVGPYVYKDSNYALVTINRFAYCGCIADVAGFAVYFSVNCRLSTGAIRARVGNHAAPKKAMWSESSKVERFRTYSEVPYIPSGMAMYNKYVDALVALNNSIWNSDEQTMSNGDTVKFMGSFLRDINSRYAKIAEIKHRITRREESAVETENAGEHEWTVVTQMLQTGGVKVRDALLQDALTFFSRDDYKDADKKQTEDKSQALRRMFATLGERVDLAWLATMIYNVDNTSGSETDSDYIRALMGKSSPSVILKMLASRNKKELSGLSENMMMVAKNDHETAEKWAQDFEAIRQLGDQIATLLKTHTTGNILSQTKVQMGKFRSQVGTHVKMVRGASLDVNSINFYMPSTLLETSPGARVALAMCNVTTDIALFGGSKENSGIYQDVPPEVYRLDSSAWVNEVTELVKGDPFAAMVWDICDKLDMSNVKKIELIWHSLDAATQVAVHMLAMAVAIDSDNGSQERDSPMAEFNEQALQDIYALTNKSMDKIPMLQKIASTEKPAYYKYMTTLVSVLRYYSQDEYVSPQDYAELKKFILDDYPEEDTRYDAAAALIYKSNPRKRALYTKVLSTVFGVTAPSGNAFLKEMRKTAGMYGSLLDAVNQVKIATASGAKKLKEAAEDLLKDNTEATNNVDRYYLTKALRSIYFIESACNKTNLRELYTKLVGESAMPATTTGIAYVDAGNVYADPTKTPPDFIEASGAPRKSARPGTTARVTM